jgi:adenylylsulfate kinase
MTAVQKTGPTVRPGFVVWFTGPPGAGKSTLAEALQAKLQSAGRNVALLDGDVIREKVSADLGFSKADRDEQVRRVGALAAEHLDEGQTVLAALVSPYREAREKVREGFGPGHFLLVHCDCPLEALIARDPKGMYAKALAGEIQNFTGIDDPYEAPLEPDVRVQTDEETVEQSLLRVWDALMAGKHVQDGAS